MAETAIKMLVLGGARSGKSAFAQAQAEASGLACVYIATATAFDDEMRERIAQHVATRGPRWRTLEAPRDLAGTMDVEGVAGSILLVDCLTLWLSNVMLAGDDVEAAVDDLVAAAARLSNHAIFVSNEVGSGIVPETALGRRFRDAQGRLNQAMAKVCEDVVLVTAGIPQMLKPALAPARSRA